MSQLDISFTEDCPRCEEKLDIHPRSRHTDVETSHLAASSVVESSKTQRALILNYLSEFGPATHDRIDEHHGWRNATAARRLSELRDHGLVVMLTGTAKTRSGRQARLWKAI